MRHDYNLRGQVFGLRPATLDDAPFILKMRTDPDLSRYIHPVSNLLADQVAWMQRYFERPGDYYFIVERLTTGRPEGTIGLYDIDVLQQSGEWGRWIMRHGSLAATESALLIYRFAFDVLPLQWVCCHTSLLNNKVISFHNSCGLTDGDPALHRWKLGEVWHDMLQQRLTRDAWPACQRVLATNAGQIARLLNR